MNNESEQDYHGHNAANYGEDEMASIVTHTQLPDNLIVVDKEWLKEKCKDVNGGATTATIVLQDLLTGGNSYPLNPILEDAWNKSIDSALINWDIESRDKDKQSYLSQPLTLKK